MPLLWRIFLGNALVLGVASTLLVVSPATVSFPAAARELVVLGVGLAVMLALNYALLRRALAPVERLPRVMRTIDPLAPGRRADLPGGPREVAQLGAAFDEMLDRLERERRDSARRALSAQEEERRRLARELHDEVGQALTAVLLQLEGAERNVDGAARERVREAREATRATLEEVRAIARGLRPEALDDLGLASALRQLCTEAERSGVIVRRSIAPELALEPEAEVVVYRVAQEAITNALRHSGAEAIDVVLAADEAGVTLTVRDDGRGFDGEPSDGTGLRGMRERAVLAGGRLDVLATPGRGTDVTLRLP